MPPSAAIRDAVRGFNGRLRRRGPPGPELLAGETRRELICWAGRDTARRRSPYEVAARFPHMPRSASMSAPHRAGHRAGREFLGVRLEAPAHLGQLPGRARCVHSRLQLLRRCAPITSASTRERHHVQGAQGVIHAHRRPGKRAEHYGQAGDLQQQRRKIPLTQLTVRLVKGAQKGGKRVVASGGSWSPPHAMPALWPMERKRSATDVLPLSESTALQPNPPSYRPCKQAVSVALSVSRGATSRQVVYKGDRVILVCDGYTARAITSSCSCASMVGLLHDSVTRWFRPL